MKSGSSPAGVPLPPQGLRQGGEHFRTNEGFMAGGLRDVARLQDHAGLGPGARLVDLGCGSGRLAIGLLDSGLDIQSYVGLEVQRRHVDWCTRFLSARDQRYKFIQVDSANARYNAGGSEDQPWPVADDSADAVYAYSVFSHMLSDEVSSHLREAARVADYVALTAFLEEDCPSETENPPDYGPVRWGGPLHCVRFEQDHFVALARAAGLKLTHLDHASDSDGQSFALFRRSA